MPTACRATPAPTGSCSTRTATRAPAATSSATSRRARPYRTSISAFEPRLRHATNPIAGPPSRAGRRLFVCLSVRERSVRLPETQQLGRLGAEALRLRLVGPVSEQRLPVLLHPAHPAV